MYVNFNQFYHPTANTTLTVRSGDYVILIHDVNYGDDSQYMITAKRYTSNTVETIPGGYYYYLMTLANTFQEINIKDENNNNVMNISFTNNEVVVNALNLFKRSFSINFTS